MATGKGNNQSYSADLRKAFVRMTSLVVFILMLIAPPFFFNDSGTFTHLRDRFATVWALPSLTEKAQELTPLLLVGFGALVGLAINGMGYSLRKQGDPASDEVKASRVIRSLDISEAVKRGNGLVSQPFLVPIVWIVSPKGAERIMIDNRIIRYFPIHFTPMRFLGKKTYGYRFAMGGMLIKEISATALSCDGFEVSLTVSVGYRVRDSNKAIRKVFREGDHPIIRIEKQIQGTLGLYIRSHERDALWRDQGNIKQDLLEDLQKELDCYEINVVNLLNVDGDRRIYDIHAETEAEKEKRKYIIEKGPNEILEASYQIQIKELNDKLEDVILGKAHIRDVQLLLLKSNAANQEKLIDLAKDIVVRLGDVTLANDVVEHMLKVIHQTPIQDNKEPLADRSPTNWLEDELRTAELFQPRIGYKTFKIDNGQAEFHFAGYSLLIDYTEGYSNNPPIIRLISEKLTNPIELPSLAWWKPDTYLYEVISNVKALIPIYLDGSDTKGA